MKAIKRRGMLMGILNALTKSSPSPFCSAIITAAGSGTRMGGVSKQLIPIDKKEVVVYSVDAFHACEYIKEIVVSAKEEEIPVLQQIFSRYNYTKPIKVVRGGDTRQSSVANAFYQVNKKSKFVAIHDGARPLLRTSDVRLLLKECFRHGAVSAASPVTDTIKRVNEKGFIAEDLDRSTLWAVQTPQVFSCDIYKAALAMAQKDKLSVTDDNALVTHAGFAVKLCSLSSSNIKLTTPEDVSLVEAILKNRKDAL